MESTIRSTKSSHRGRQYQQSCPVASICRAEGRASSVPPHATLPTRSPSFLWYPQSHYRIPRVRLPDAFNPFAIYPYESYCKNIDYNIEPPMCPFNDQPRYTRYTTQDWHNVHMKHYLTADKIRSASIRLRSDAARLAQEKDEQAINNHSESSRYLDERIKDIEHWKNELEKTRNKLKCKIDDVALKQREVTELLCGIDNMYRIAKENLHEREKRLGIDLVHDHVEQELIREIDAIKSSQHKLREMVKNLDKQNALNRASLYILDRDTQNKSQAIEIDCTAHNLVLPSPGVCSSDGILLVDNTVTVPESWAQYTERNIHRALIEISQSDELINSCNNLIAATKNGLWSQWNCVNASLDNRIKEARSAADKIQYEVEKTLQEISNVEESTAYLQRNIADKEEFLKVARARLEVRAQRPHVEACHDSAMQKLIQEVDDLHTAIGDLHAKLRQEENTLQCLLHVKSTLEKDLAIKQNSLSIDSEKVMGMRRTFLTDLPVKNCLPRASTPPSYHFIDL